MSIRLLTFTTLYPNANQPSHGIFVENRLTQLIASRQATVQVVAPVAYVPNWAMLPDRYRTLSRVPDREERRGITIHHPRYLLLPKVSMLAAPFSLYIAARRSLRALLRNGYDFEIIDAHYFYPDGVAAVLLGRYFGKPVTVTARGSDINFIARDRLPRRMIRWACTNADAIAAVSQALKDALVALGASPDKIRVLRNGVDLVKFQEGDREAARRHIGVNEITLLSVGNLVPLKGHDLAIRALALLDNASLIIVGDGPEAGKLHSLAETLAVAHRVRFLGRLPHDELPELYGAADVLLLLSSSEGWPNVLLEAMACGTPVVATDVGGTREVVATSANGAIVTDRDPVAIAQAITRTLRRGTNRSAVRAYAEGIQLGGDHARAVGDVSRDTLQTYEP